MTVKAMKYGAVEFLTKPFGDQDLLDAIYQALDRYRATRQHRTHPGELALAFGDYTALRPLSFKATANWIPLRLLRPLEHLQISAS